MRKTFILLQAIHPPILLGIMCFILFSYVIGDFETKSFFFYLGLIGFVIFIADAFNRLSEFKKMKEKLKNKEANLIFLLKKSKYSWCTREMAKAAAKHYSFVSYIRAQKFYKELGFQWYHFFPIGTFRKDSIWFKKNFWKNTFLSFKKKN